MSVGQREKATQKRVIKLFVQELGYTYLGDLTERENSNIETELLTKFLTRKGYSPVLISRALKELQDAAGDQSVNLYDLNEQTYKKLRYGVKVSESVGQHKITVQFVDWEHPLENDFYIAEEVTISTSARSGAVHQRHRFCGHRAEAQHSFHVGGHPPESDQSAPGYDHAVLFHCWAVLAGNDSEGCVTVPPAHQKSIIFPGKKIPTPKTRFP